VHVLRGVPGDDRVEDCKELAPKVDVAPSLELAQARRRDLHDLLGHRAHVLVQLAEHAPAGRHPFQLGIERVELALESRECGVVHCSPHFPAFGIRWSSGIGVPSSSTFQYSHFAASLPQ